MDELVFERQIKKRPVWRLSADPGKMNWRLVVVAEGCMRVSLALIDS
jgi:hypothetical protein